MVNGTLDLVGHINYFIKLLSSFHCNTVKAKSGENRECDIVEAKAEDFGSYSCYTIGIRYHFHCRVCISLARMESMGGDN